MTVPYDVTTNVSGRVSAVFLLALPVQDIGQEVTQGLVVSNKRRIHHHGQLSLLAASVSGVSTTPLQCMRHTLQFHMKWAAAHGRATGLPQAHCRATKPSHKRRAPCCGCPDAAHPAGSLLWVG